MPEQHAQEGFVYEVNASKALKKLGISTGETAGASHDKPDLMLKSGTKLAGCELKNAPTAAGSLVMWYQAGKWKYGDGWKNSVEKTFLHDIGEKAGLLREMNSSGSAGKNWRGKKPAQQNDMTGRKILFGAKDSEKAYKIDLAQFGGPNEIHLTIPARGVSDYYNSKKTYYLNVGTHGFFLLNSSDPLKLNEGLRRIGKPAIPDFGSSTKVIIRMRCQYKGSGSYQFSMTLQFGSVSKSPYNVAPLRPGSASIIDEQRLQADPIVLAFNTIGQK